MTKGDERWPKKPLGTVASVASGYAFKSSEFTNAGVPVIKIKNIRVGEVDLSEVEYVDEKYLAIPARYHVKAGDVLISLTGSHLSQPNSVVGRVARHSSSKPRCLLNQRGGKVIVRNQKDTDLGFLFYALSESETTRTIALKAHGAANQANVSPSQVESVEIPLPPLPVQRRIAGVLSAYDDLIENNLRRIIVLEQIARTLYQEWFVTFRFPGHEKGRMVDSPLGDVPEGWKVASLLEIPYFEFIDENIRPYDGTKAYYATADVDGIEITGEGIEYTYKEKPSRAAKQPVLNSVWFARMQETYKVIAFTSGNATLTQCCMLSSGFAGFRSPDDVTLAFLFCTINSKDFHASKDRFCTGATQRSLTNEGMGRIQIVVPPRELVEKFGEVVHSKIDLIMTLQCQNKVLRRTRQLLLPKLISGELDVSEIDIAVPVEVV